MNLSAGARIAELRKARGWTQSQLAQKAEISPSAVAMYETNRRVPDAAVLDRMARAFGIRTDELEQEPATDSAVRPVQPTSPVAQRSMTTENTQVAPGRLNLSTMSLTREEARFILFVRMNPQCRSFLESYILADEQKRQQLERTMRLIHDFQK